MKQKIMGKLGFIVPHQKGTWLVSFFDEKKTKKVADKDLHKALKEIQATGTLDGSICLGTWERK
jgi:hypothetical protein